MFIIAGILAATSSWLIKASIIRIFGPKSILYLIPLIEEILKTFSAIIFNTSIIYSHTVFGTIEAGRSLSSWRNQGLTQGLTIFMGNILFGYITSEFYYLYQTKLIAISGAYFLHIIWNLFLTKLSLRE
jgi:hypothetical protein